MFEAEDFISLKASILLYATTLKTWSWEGKLVTLVKINGYREFLNRKNKLIAILFGMGYL